MTASIRGGIFTMAMLLKGAEVAKALTEGLHAKTEELKKNGVEPCLAILRVGAREDDLAYERGALKRCEKVGVAVRQVVLPEDVTQKVLMENIHALNADEKVHGVLMFRPLPGHLDDEAARAALDPKKDMDGITDGSFRPDNAVTLEEAVTAILKLMGYKMTDLSGSFPNAQLNKASELGLRNQVDRSQGEALNYEECALLFYNALTANTASGSAYGSSLGFTVSNGQVDTSSVMLKSLKGPFVAGDTVQLPFVPKMVYRNDKASESAELNKYDVYYYSESLQTLWICTRRAAGRITAVSPSASAPTSVTVAGTSYTLGSSAVASQVSSLNGGGVGEVVTLLLGMNNEAAGIVTGEEADSVFYGVVQTATRSLVEENGADVLQKVSVMCTDGIARTVNVDKSLNFPQGWLVEIKVTPEGESVEHIDDRRVNGTINTNATALGAAALADDVEILDTTSEGVAGTVRPSRLSGVTLSDLDVRYYTVNDAGQIDRLILNDVTGDLWSYGVLDDVKNLAMNYSDLKNLFTGIAAGDSASGTTTTTGTTTGSTTGGTDGSGSTSGTTAPPLNTIGLSGIRELGLPSPSTLPIVNAVAAISSPFPSTAFPPT